MLARTRYNVEPSKLKEYPVGMTKLATRRGTPKSTIFSSSRGSAASLDAVENAVTAGSRTHRKKSSKRTLVIHNTGTKTKTNRQTSAK